MADDNQIQGDIQVSGINNAAPATNQPAQTASSSQPASTQQDDQAQDKNSVPDSVKQKFPDLQELIQTTESMNDEERDYWFQILPIMTEDQIARFREILLNEKNQLAKLDKEYEQQITQLNEKHMLEWKEFESKEKRKAIETAEAQAEQSETEKEKELLERLANI